MSTSSTRILYVDDNQDSSDLASLMLYHSDNTYSVTAISNAEEALSAMENQMFDLYILDYALPKMSGVELCRKIRHKDKQTPIMFFTAMARDADRESGLAAGANEYLVKPDDLENLTETVKRLLKRKKFYSKHKDMFSRHRDVYRRRCSTII